MTDPGNSEQVRKIAHQLFETWKSEQGRQRASWPAWLALGLSGFGLVFSAGALRSDVATAHTRLEKLEHRADGTDRTATQVSDRLARIETKLDLALEKRR
ncbi:MAG TPA: hypothetical protein PKD48_02025 [Sphingopyxis sp.]|nr:hypothetical protein [Sphingopyxis sp.]